MQVSLLRQALAGSESRFVKSSCQVHGIFITLIRSKSAFQIVWHRSLVIERAGMQPDAIRAIRPSLFSSTRQQVLAQPAADKFRQQTEVSNLCRTIFAASQLEITRRSLVISHHPQRNY